MLKFLIAAAVVTFDNGMVACVTKNNRLALVDKAGVSVAPKYMPDAASYCERNSPIMIQHSVQHMDDHHLEVVWVDEDWDFENGTWDFDSSVTPMHADSQPDASLALAYALTKGNYRAKELMAA